MNSTLRYNNVSVAKGVGIIMMVIAHSFASPNLMTNFICLFHMPIFYFLSGYCFKDKYLTAKLRFFKNGIKSLYIPFLVANVIFILLHNILFKLNIYSEEYGFLGQGTSLYEPKDFIKSIYYAFRFRGSQALLGGLWFLASLFFARLIFLCVRYCQSKIDNNKYKKYISGSILLAMISFCLLDFYIPALFGSREVFGAILMWGGYSFKKYQEKFKRFAIHIIIISLIICTIYAVYRPLYFSSSPLTFDRFDYIIPCFAGCLMMFYVCSINWIANLSHLIYIGSHTLIILILHFLCFKPVSLLHILINDLDIKRLSEFAVMSDTPPYLWILYTIFGVALPLLLREIYLKFHENIILRLRGPRRIRQSAD